jgi:hypothetical protein
MKKLKLWAFLGCLFLINNSCQEPNIETKEKEEETQSFLRDIRAVYFENLNFDSPKIRASTPQFIENFEKTYRKLEKEHSEGKFTSPSDLENFQLAGMYYSFYLLAIGGTYSDKDLTFNNINGSRPVGLYSKLPANSYDFEQKELEAMMERARYVSHKSTYLLGFNDKAYGFYLAVRQVQERVKNKNNFNNPIAHDSLMNYTSTYLLDYEDLGVWNILMTMATITNYKDSLNTFKNPNMDIPLFNINTRLVPGALRDLGGRLPEILGPLYRFDINLKKVDWLIQQNKTLSEDELSEINKYLTSLDRASNYILNDKRNILEAWDYKESFFERVRKVQDLKAALVNHSMDKKKTRQSIDLGSFIDSKVFKKPYTCYGCHQDTGL